MKAALENAELELDLAVYNELTSLEKNLVAKNYVLMALSLLMLKEFKRN